MNVIKFLDEWNLENFEDISVSNVAENTKVFVNGDWVLTAPEKPSCSLQRALLTPQGNPGSLYRRGRRG